MPVEITYSFGTLFEVIEWDISIVATKETGVTYVATEGDVWDAHKDIALAAMSAAVTMMITYLVSVKKKVV